MITRHRCGKGFSYRDGGRTIRDARLRRWIRALAIPPAWIDVEIDPDPDAKIHATGRDAAGRKQYIYNPAWRTRRDRAKFARIVRFAQRLGTMRRVTGQHLARHDNSREKVLACMVRLIDTAYFRPGNDQYAAENESYGLTTMCSRHLTIEGDELIFRYVGKAGKPQEKHIEDERLAGIVAELDEMPGREIFKYFDADGNKVTVDSGELNAYIHHVMGEDFSAKDFRTWAGTSLAAQALDEMGPAPSARAAEANIRAAIRAVAERLGNTPAVTRGSYVDPRVLDCYRAGCTLSSVSAPPVPGNHVGELERAVLALLKHRVRRTHTAKA